MDDEAVIPAGLEGFIEQARALCDEDRLALAAARRAANEVVRAGAWKAANEMLPPRARAYVAAWGRIGSAFVPERLEDLVRRGSGVDTSEVARWQEVARLVRVAIDDALLALLLADTIPPPDVRELYDPWKTMLALAYEARTGE